MHREAGSAASPVVTSTVGFASRCRTGRTSHQDRRARDRELGQSQLSRRQAPSSSVRGQRGAKPPAPFRAGEAWAHTNSAEAFLPCLRTATRWLTFTRMSQGKEKQRSLIIVLLLFDSGVLLKGKKHREQLISCS